MHVLLRCCFSLFPMLFLPLPDGSPWQQHLCHGAASRHRAPASSISATAAPLASSIFPMAFRRSAPASNKPHPAEKSTPVWLAIWRTWAGFANSQHRDAAFATPDNICAHSSLLPHWAAAQTDANLSAHLHRLPTPPPYLRQMRLLHGRGAGVGCKMRLLSSRAAGIGWQMLMLPGLVRRSCKSPRARIPVLGTSGAHWPARWPRFVLTERLIKS